MKKDSFGSPYKGLNMGRSTQILRQPFCTAWGVVVLHLTV